MERHASLLDPSVAPRSGFTLLELITVVTLLALTLSELLPAARRSWDRFAVVGAREEVVGLFHRARLEAVARGGASVTLSADPPRVEIWAGGELLDASSLDQEYDVALLLSRERARVEIHFDPLGLGRVASQTLRFARGEAEAVLVVSSFGRMTRR